MRRYVGSITIKLGSLHLFGLLQGINFECALGLLADAIKCGGVECKVYGLILLLPVSHGDTGFKSGVSKINAALITPGFACGIGDVRVDGISECGFVRSRYAVVRLGGELHIKGTIRFGGHVTMGNFLTFPLRDRTPPVVPAPPDGVTYFAHDTPLDLCIIDGCAGVSGSFTR